jgi:hypothetical protein
MVQLKSAEIIYPESDGKPIADNTKQFRLLVGIEQNLEQKYREHFGNLPTQE